MGKGSLKAARAALPHTTVGNTTRHLLNIESEVLLSRYLERLILPFVCRACGSRELVTVADCYHGCFNCGNAAATFLDIPAANTCL